MRRGESYLEKGEMRLSEGEAAAYTSSSITYHPTGDQRQQRNDRCFIWCIILSRCMMFRNKSERVIKLIVFFHAFNYKLASLRT